MKKYAFVIEVDEVDAGEAYDHHRPISGLLLRQVRDLHIAEQHLPVKERTGINIAELHTELDASNFVRRVTERLIAKNRKPKAKVSSRKSKASAKRSDVAKNKRKTTAKSSWKSK